MCLADTLHRHNETDVFSEVMAIGARDTQGADRAPAHCLTSVI